MKTALEQLGLETSQANPLAMGNLQKIIFNTNNDSEARLVAALEGLNITGEGSGGGGVPQIRNALLLSADKEALRAALNDLLGTFNRAPTDIAWAGVHTVAEDAALGTQIGGVLSATDPDLDSVTFSIPDVASLFSISGTTVRVAGVLDFETSASHNVTIRVTDTEDNFFDEAFAITVTDVSETPPDDPLPPGDDIPGDEGEFDVPPYSVDVDGAVKLAGKKKNTGFVAKMLHNIIDDVPLVVERKFTMRYDPDFTQMANDGVLNMVGFVFKAGNDFYMVGLRGDGSIGLDKYEVSGDGLWTSTAGFTVNDGGAPANGTQAGPNWIQLETSEDGAAITFRTSGDDGETFDDEFTDIDFPPFTNISEVTAWGPGAFFAADDHGPYSIEIDIWTSEDAAELWTPAALGADVLRWYEASDASNFNLTGSTVNQWNDISGNADGITAAADVRPTRETVADFGGLNAVKFDGSDDALTGGLLTEAQPFTLVFMYRTGTAIDDLDMIFEGNNSVVSLRWSGGANKPHAFAGSGVVRSDTVLSTSTPYIDIVLFNGASSTTRINGNTPAPATFNPGAGGIADFGLNARGGFSPFSGHYAEVLIINRALTSDENEKMEGYLAHKRARTADLPGGHAYKTDPPTI